MMTVCWFYRNQMGLLEALWAGEPGISHSKNNRTADMRSNT